MILFSVLEILADAKIQLTLINGSISVSAPNGAVTPTIMSMLKEHKSELIVHLQRFEKAKNKIAPVDRNKKLHLSFAQERLWLLDQIDSGNAHQNIPSAFKLTGTLNPNALEQAFTTILERHESLRTCFVVREDGELLQVIQAATPFHFRLTDLSTLEESERQFKLAEFVAEECGRPFNLSCDLMLRAQLIKVADDEHIVLVTMHHIASDGWSMGILINEFSALYGAYAQGQHNPLSPLPIQYADYAHWQRNWLQGEVLDRQLNYWEKQLAGLPVVHSVPLDHERSQLQTFTGNTITSQVDVQTNDNLIALCQSQGATLFMGLQTAFSVLLSRYSNETDIVMGSFIANREQKEIANLIGFFINSLVLRSDLSGTPSFFELLQQNKKMLLDAYAHQQVPFEKIVERLQPERSLNHSALFQIMIVFQNNKQGTLILPDLTLGSAALIKTGISEFDLTLEINENEHGLKLDWKYNTDLFEQNTIAGTANHFELLLKTLVKKPNENVFSIDMLSDRERQQLLVEWNNTQVDYPYDKCVHELFEAQANNNPDAIAVVLESQQLTYRKLNEKANQLAHYLINEKHVKPDTLVGICVERSLEMVIGILAILKAGGAYVPLDPEYPEARLKYMLDDAQLTTVLTQRHLRESTPVSDEQAVCLDDENIQHQLEMQLISNPSPQQLGLTSSHLAYVIYTSGSTGNPKGVMILHGSVINLVCALRESYQLSATDSILQFAPMSFDMSVEEIFGALCNGCALVLRTEYWLESTNQFWQNCSAAKVTVLNLPTAFWHELARDNHEIQTTYVRHISIGGEKLNKLAISNWFKKNTSSPVLLNAYGPTECTVNASFAKVNLDSGNSIGRALNNTQLLVMNSSGVLAPVGVAGELHLGGVGLARGYLNRPDLTAEKFIPNPFYDKTNSLNSERLYKTGDLVRWLPNGNLDFLGRIDHQVKIRGFRIELGEIENVLLAHPNVNDTVVLAKESATTGSKQLIAYMLISAINLQDDSAASILARQELIEDLRHYLNQALPDYMVPSAFVLLEQLPLTPNGKVDRKALPEANIFAQQNTYVAPSTKTEKILCEIWQDILGVERVGVTDNFFQLGGHSLLIMQMISRLQQHGLLMTARQLFVTPLAGELAKALDGSTTQSAFKAPPNLIPDGCENITPEMLSLVNLTVEEIALIVAQIPGGASSVQDIYPLGPLQEGILYHHMMSVQGDTYAMSTLYKINGYEEVLSFIEALQFVINRHDVMRTAVFWKDLSVPVQVVCRHVTLPVFWLELDESQSIEAQMRTRFVLEQQWFELDQAPLIRLQIAADPKSEQHFILLQNHHIISDHVGVEIIQKEISIYQSGLGNSLSTPTPYREFVAHAQHQALHNDSESFFTKMLGNVDEPTTPFDLRDVKGDGSRIIELISNIPADIATQIRNLAKDIMISPAAVFHTAWAMVVASCSGRNDVVFGTVLSGRLQGICGAEDTLGVFINTLPLRVNLQNHSVIDTVREVQELLHNLLPYEQASLALAQRCSGLPAGLPLFTAIFNYRHSFMPEANVTDTTNSVHNLGIELVMAQERTNYPFNISVDDFGHSFALEVQIDQSIGAKRITDYMQTALAELVKALAFTPNSAINTLSIIPTTERNQLLVDWNNTQTDYPNNKCIHELFEAQVESNPNAIAVVFEDQQLTYQELNQKANQLAHYLINEKHVTPDTLVGICVERSLEMVIGILAILKSGGAYVPLDPEYPEARLKYMLDDAGLTTVLTQSHLRETTPVSDAQALCLDSAEFQQQLQAQPTENKNTLPSTPSNLAYVIYTSGSTGSPKGVMVEHSALVNRIDWMNRKYGSSPSDRILQKTPFSFDVSVWEFAWPLSVGAGIVLAKPEGHKDPVYLSELIRDQHITKLHFVPSMLGIILSLGDLSQCTSLRQVFCSGEALSLHHVEEFQAICPWVDLHNLYGPTEAAIDVSYWDCAQSHMGLSSVPIGRPINNIQLHVLNSHLNTVPQGVAGELHIGGVGLARGYLHREDLTAEKFIVNPFYDKTNPASSERLYKTGDLVRWLQDGNLEFLGRIDHQVKIRGFRIELGEIENTISAYSAVKDAIVLAKESTTGDKRLVAYVVTDEIDLQSADETVMTARHELIEDLRHHITQTLPDYMVPSAFVLLEQLPLTPNGKVDRKALPELDLSVQQHVYVAPSTETEKILCEIWQEVLGVERVGITDNFFSLGGHSILLIKLFTQLKKSLHQEIQIRDFFELGTIQLLAEKIDTQSSTLETDIAFDQVTTKSADQTEELIL